jgi:hypothetical protein
MTQIELNPIEAIVEAIGGTLDQSETRWNHGFHYRGVGFTITQSGPRYNIWARPTIPGSDLSRAPHCESDRFFEAQFRTMSFSVNRKPEDIARDFVRRANVEAYHEYIHLFQEEEAEYTRYRDSCRALADELAGIIGQGLRNPNESDETYQVVAQGDWYSSHSTPIKITGDTAEFSLRGVKNKELMIELARVITKYVE